MIIAFLIFVVVVMVVAVVAGVINGINQARLTTAPVKTSMHRGRKFKHPTKANNNPLPDDPRFYNIGSQTYHWSKECSGFSLLKTWDAIPELQARQMGMTGCPLCRNTIAFIYPRGKVYHKTKFCSDARSIPVQVSETEAIARGLHRCSKCW